MHVYARAQAVANYGSASERESNLDDHWIGAQAREQLFALFFHASSRGRGIVEDPSGTFRGSTLYFLG